MPNINRQPRGNSSGGQFAPDRSGIAAPTSAPTIPGSPITLGEVVDRTEHFEALYDALQASTPVRCHECGQFQSAATYHHCPHSQRAVALLQYSQLATSNVLSEATSVELYNYLVNLHNSRSPEEQRSYTLEDYKDFLNRSIQRTEGFQSSSTQETREEILATLREELTKAENGEMPDQAEIYALRNLTPTIRDHANAQNRSLSQLASDLGTIRDEVRTELHTLESEYYGGTTIAVDEEDMERAEILAPRHSTPAEKYAYAALSHRHRRLAADRALAGVQRIERNVHAGTTPHQGLSLIESGYDPRSNRLEVTIHDISTGENTTYAYTNIDAETAQSIQEIRNGVNPAEYWFNNVRGNPEYAYRNQITADLASAAPRCNVCGQFANSSHTCPIIPEAVNMRRNNTSSRWSRQNVTVTTEMGTSLDADITLPAIRELRTAFNESGVVSVGLDEFLNIPTSEGRSFARVTGAITVYRHPDTNETLFNTADTSCACRRSIDPSNLPPGDCPHVTIIQNAILARLTPTVRTARTPEEREAALRAAQERAEAAASSDWTRNEETLAEARRTWRENSEVIYSENFEAFEAAFNAAKEARANTETTYTPGRSSIPYMTENALGGFAQRGSDQAFGMEIEYEFPPSISGVDRQAAQQRIGEALYDAGLSRSRRRAGYGSSRHYGFQDTHTNSQGESNWSWEADGSVNGGELVTPAMYDEPETWQKLETAVRILRENGAIPTKKAGAHVHVGTAMYAGSPDKYTELARIMTQHEDVITRLASDPTRGTHRNNQYSRPLSAVPVQGFQSVSSARSWQGGRYRYLNLAGVNTQQEHSTGDHPEFRLFDSTLDAGAMQAQIKLSVALTHAAARNADLGGTTRGKEPLGSHGKRNKGIGRRQQQDSEHIKNDTATFRSLLDTLFTRKEDKDQLIHLFAANKWTNSNRS